MVKLPAIVAGLLLASTYSAANASWVLIPGDTNDTRLHGCGASWEICKQRKAAKTPRPQSSKPRPSGRR
jgi:hypothetical protein